ncbi:hypothetical protein [Burkholderia cepacia]|uniref:hypothetical protein n=1 Tax=Burkholderia cepacia TaxID=292 RepID=UPI00178805D5|nr:hypothetical protein [Burkholderia cepacia]
MSINDIAGAVSFLAELLERESSDTAREIRHLYRIIRNAWLHKEHVVVAGVSKEAISGLLRCCRARGAGSSHALIARIMATIL